MLLIGCTSLGIATGTSELGKRVQSDLDRIESGKPCDYDKLQKTGEC